MADLLGDYLHNPSSFSNPIIIYSLHMPKRLKIASFFLSLTPFITPHNSLFRAFGIVFILLILKKNPRLFQIYPYDPKLWLLYASTVASTFTTCYIPFHAQSHLLTPFTLLKSYSSLFNNFFSVHFLLGLSLPLLCIYFDLYLFIHPLCMSKLL